MKLYKIICQHTYLSLVEITFYANFLRIIKLMEKQRNPNPNPKTIQDGGYWLFPYKLYYTQRVLTYYFLVCYHLYTNIDKISGQLRDNDERKYTNVEVVCIQMLDFETLSSKLEVSESNSWQMTSISKTTSLQREPILTMFFTINLSPLLVTK